jgi:hypothetical protein
MGEGRKSHRAGGWMLSVEINFVDRRGKTVRIWTNYEWWSEGEGDWPVAPGFESFITSMLEKHKPTSQPASSVAVR